MKVSLTNFDARLLRNPGIIVRRGVLSNTLVPQMHNGNDRIFSRRLARGLEWTPKTGQLKSVRLDQARAVIGG